MCAAASTLRPGDHPALYCSSRLTLNLTRGARWQPPGTVPRGRFFEAAACGAPMITDWFRGLDSFFEPGQEVLVAGDTQKFCICSTDPTRSCGERRVVPVSAPSTSIPDTSVRSPCCGI